MSEPTNWSQRYKQNVEMLRSGRLENVHLVAERLDRRRAEQGLSSAEERMLRRAQSILATEALFGWPERPQPDE